MRRVAIAGLVLAAGFAVLPATASATTLYGSVNAARQITLKLDGDNVTHLAAGTYTVIVTDSTPNHNFHLHGPGVDVATPVGNLAGTVVETWVVTFSGGTYGFNCDRHPGSMWGSFTVGDVLSVTRSGTGSGLVTSTPGGIDCGGVCLFTFPGPTAAILQATPLSGSEFLGWSGACSGLFDCALSVSGYTSVTATFRKLAPPPPPESPPPPPVETAPASVKRIVVKRANGVRTVRVTLAVTRHTGGEVALRRKGRAVASKSLHVAPGTRTVQMKAPKKAAAGAYVVKLTLVDSASGKSFVVTRRVTL